MRGLALILITVILVPAGLISPVIGIYGYVWFSLVRPDALAWMVGVYPMSLALALSTLIGAARYVNRIGTLFRNPISVLLILLMVPIVMSAMFAVDPALAWPPLNLYLRIIMMALLLPVLLHSELELRRLLFIMAASLGFIGFKFGLFGVRAGGIQFSEGYAGFLGDSNGLALAMVMAFPLCWYSMSLASSKWVRLGFLAMAGGTIATTVMTFSRGNSIGLAVILLLTAIRSQRKFLIVIMLLALAGPAVYLVYDKYVNRMSTIATYEEEQSASSRLVYARAALAMSRDYPVLGVGFGTTNYIALSHRYLGYEAGQVVHNTYLQMLVDSGIIAFGLYITMLLTALVYLQRSKWRMRRLNSPLVAYPLAFQTSLLGFCMGSTFYSRISLDLLYFVLMATAVWYGVERTVLAEAEQPEQSLLSSSQFHPLTPQPVGPQFGRAR
jgi:probable O-glycosylation ligase (exosortase A-associated)